MLLGYSLCLSHVFTSMYVPFTLCRWLDCLLWSPGRHKASNTPKITGASFLSYLTASSTCPLFVYWAVPLSCLTAFVDNHIMVIASSTSSHLLLKTLYSSIWIRIKTHSTSVPGPATRQETNLPCRALLQELRRHANLREAKPIQLQCCSSTSTKTGNWIRGRRPTYDERDMRQLSLRRCVRLVYIFDPTIPNSRPHFPFARMMDTRLYWYYTLSDKGYVIPVFFEWL